MRFSIAIPTRNKCDTLRSTLESCLQQIDAPPYEVVVFDNFSSDETQSVVQASNDDRVRYKRSAEPLCMTDSWERCLAMCQGEYVVVVGSDDALLPSALHILELLLKEHPGVPIRWSPAYYHWENSPRTARQGLVTIPLGAAKRFTDSRKRIHQVARFRAAYESLPMLYNSCIPRSTLETIRKKAGRVLLSANPDISSGMATAMLHKHYLVIDAPLGIAGSSAGSNGSSAFEVRSGRASEKSSTFNLFSEMNKAAGFGYHAQLPQLTLISLGIVDAYLRVSEKIDGITPAVDQKALLDALRLELTSAIAEPMRSRMAEVIEEHYNIPLRLEPSKIGERPLSDEGQTIALGYHKRQSCLVIDARRFDCHDIASVSTLCERTLAIRETVQRLRFQSRPSSRARTRTALKALLGRVEDPQWF